MEMEIQLEYLNFSMYKVGFWDLETFQERKSVPLLHLSPGTWDYN